MNSKIIVSIDLWGTLIKGSPKFKEEKCKLVQSYFPDYEINNIEKSFIKTKRVFDQIIERTGYQPEYNHLLYYLFSCFMIRHQYRRIGIETFINLEKDYAQLAIEHNPTIYNEQTINLLKEMSSQYQLTLSSNTLFLKGKTLRTIMDKINISKYFTEMNFSDECEVSKPHCIMYGNSKYHIGDNMRTDYYGAVASNIKPFLVHTNDKTLKDAYEFIIEQERL